MRLKDRWAKAKNSVSKNLTKFHNHLFGKPVPKTWSHGKSDGSVHTVKHRKMRMLFRFFHIFTMLALAHTAHADPPPFTNGPFISTTVATSSPLPGGIMNYHRCFKADWKTPGDCGNTFSGGADPDTSCGPGLVAVAEVGGAFQCSAVSSTTINNDLIALRAATKVTTDTLRVDLTNENNRATFRENDLGTSSGTIYAALNSTASALTVETNRSIAAEATLTSAVNSTGSAVTTETNRALAAEAVLSSAPAKMLISTNTDSTAFVAIISTGYMAFDNYTERISTLGTVNGGTFTLYWSTSSIVSLTLAASSTFTFANAMQGQSQTVLIEQGTGGSKLAYWTAPTGTTINFGTKGKPVLQTGDGNQNFINFLLRGTTYVGWDGGGYQ